MADEVDYKVKIKEVADQEELRREVAKKRLIIDDKRTAAQIARIHENERDLEVAKTTNFGGMTQEMRDAVKTANVSYINAARTGMSFINDTFKGVVPFFQKNLILIGGKTGEGKSTTVANIAFSTLSQINPSTGRTRKVLVITNEEKTEDVFNRITCLIKGWSYTNHDKFTDEQVETFQQFIDILGKDGRLNVIDDSYNGANGLTTSVEGICSIFDNLIRDKVYYDAVIIDYYQNIKTSKIDPALNEYEVQAMLAAALDRYKNVYPAPIVLMAQVNPPDEKNTPFEFRIKGRKIILDKCTCAIEMVANRELYLTEWHIHKSRFNESIGSKFQTGFNRGLFVPYDLAFKTKISAFKEDRMLLKATGSKLNEAIAKAESKEETQNETA